MKGSIFVRFSVLFALGLGAITFSSVAACEANSDNDFQCATRRILPPTPTPSAVALVSNAPAFVPRGGSPLDAMDVKDEWHDLAPGAVHWYKIDNGNNLLLDVWLDSKPSGGVTLAAFSPEQTNGLSVATPPKGRAAPVKTEPSHDIFWLGSSARGVWYFLVTNTNPFPVQYMIGDKQSTFDRNCWSYWEYIGSTPVYWTKCSH